VACYPTARLRRWIQSLRSEAALVVWAALSIASASARAQTRVTRIHLEVVHAAAAQGCPSESELAATVAASLGYDPFVPLDQADRVLSASFDPVEGGIATTLSLRTRDGKALGEQRMAYAGTSCREAAAALELVISMAVDPPSSIDSGFTPPAEPAPPFAAVPDAGPLKITAPAAHANGPTFEAGLGTLLAIGSAPQVTAGFTFGVGLRWPVTSVDLEFRADLPAGAGINEVTGASLRSALIFGTIAPCLRGALLGGCALLGAGVNQASGQGLAPPNHETTPYVALGVRGLVDLVLAGPLRLQPRLELWAPLTRTTLTAVGANQWTTPPLSLDVGLALVVDLR
jgi:hypothetical protein